MTREALKKLNEKQMNYCKTLSALIDRAKIKGLKEENERNRGKLRGFLECMALCGLPVKKVWEKVREFLAKYTDELPDTDELDGDSTTGSVEEHRTQER